MCSCAEKSFEGICQPPLCGEAAGQQRGEAREFRLQVAGQGRKDCGKEVRGPETEEIEFGRGGTVTAFNSLSNTST